MNTFAALGQDPRWIEVWRNVRHEFIYLSWAFMEGSLIAAFSVGFMPWSRLWPFLLTLLFFTCLVLIPFHLSRTMHLLDIKLTVQRRVQMIGLFIAIYLSLRLLLYPGFILDPRWLGDLFASFFTENNPFWTNNLILAFMVILAWSRGISLTGRHVDIAGMGTRIRVGALILSPVAVGLAGQAQAVRVAPFILTYFLFTLLSVAIARAEEIAQSRYTQGIALPPRWFVGVLLASAAIVLAGGFLGALLSGDAAQTLQTWLGPLWTSAYFTGIILFATLGYIGQPLFRLAGYLIDRFYLFMQALLASVGAEIADDALSGPAQVLEDLQQMDETVDTVQIPFEVGRILLIALVVLFAIMVTFLIIRGFRPRLLGLGEDGRRLRRQSAAREGAGGLRGLLDRLTGFRRRQAANTVRRIYRHMCDTGNSYGFPRAESETPLEYIATLYELWPESGEQVSLITSAYIRVRYGEVPETESELDEIKNAWQHLRQTIVTP